MCIALFVHSRMFMRIVCVWSELTMLLPLQKIVAAISCGESAKLAAFFSLVKQDQ